MKQVGWRSRAAAVIAAIVTAATLAAVAPSTAAAVGSYDNAAIADKALT